MSRQLSFLLRHALQDVAPDGFVEIDLVQDLIGMSKDTIYQYVRMDDKQRFEISGKYIRACQGHTMQHVETRLLGKEILEWTRAKPLHNTLRRNLGAIQRDGLSPMKRCHVHFAVDDKMLRKNCTAQLAFDLARWLNDGHKAYMSTNGVVMVDTVIPFEYLELVK